MILAACAPVFGGTTRQKNRNGGRATTGGFRRTVQRLIKRSLAGGGIYIVAGELYMVPVPTPDANIISRAAPYSASIAVVHRLRDEFLQQQPVTLIDQQLVAKGVLERTQTNINLLSLWVPSVWRVPVGCVGRHALVHHGLVQIFDVHAAAISPTVEPRF